MAAGPWNGGKPYHDLPVTVVVKGQGLNEMPVTVVVTGRSEGDRGRAAVEDLSVANSVSFGWLKDMFFVWYIVTSIHIP
jgi:hypothetical protein